MDVLVAVIAGVSLVVAAATPSALAARRIGKPNGYSSVTKMLEDILRRLGRHEERLDKMASGYVDGQEILGRLDALDKAVTSDRKP